MHTFVTGSTGSGKSNTIYQLLAKLQGRGIPFLVIEPAKGEYKQVFGGLPGVRVLGTNAMVTELLRLNPFAFPEGVHVLEHIDRLVEIFNACWPMYAAMPAVLKEAIEQAYVVSGWDLEDSLNYSGANRFPTFRDLMDILPETIRTSEYSDEVKGNYVGALVTRVRSMTNGINGRIFSGEETESAVLFDGNCIVDLSRVGSSETKSLLMGVLVMRLQEHRSAAAGGMNGALRHVTVLEEAHNLLRRTSAEQSQEGSNLQGKAVEMLANAIAEMRTYGEGFVIADQSPGLLDLSVIRNTNTKLILRLPDEQDRLLVGRAANLNEEQIEELARLRVGVSAVYQNNWLQPVLCAMDRFETHSEYRYAPPPVTERQTNRRMLGDLVGLLLAGRAGERPDARRLAQIEPIGSWLMNQPFDDRTRRTIAAQLESLRTDGSMPIWEEAQFEKLADVVSSLFNGRVLLQSARQTRDLRQWNETVTTSIRQAADLSLDEAVETAVTQCLLREQSAADEAAKQFYFLWVEDANGRGRGIA
nr:DUF87 domain-containing protein [Cohnella fermenti]